MISSQKESSVNATDSSKIETFRTSPFLIKHKVKHYGKLDDNFQNDVYVCTIHDLLQIQELVLIMVLMKEVTSLNNRQYGKNTQLGYRYQITLDEEKKPMVSLTSVE